MLNRERIYGIVSASVVYYQEAQLFHGWRMFSHRHNKNSGFLRNFILFVMLFNIAALSSVIRNSEYWLADSSYSSPEQLFSKEFSPIENNSLGLSFHTNDLWMKIPLNEKFRGKTLVLDCPYFRETILFLPSSRGGYDSEKRFWSGSDCGIPNTLYPSFELPEHITSNDTAYVRINSIYSLNFSFQILSYYEAYDLERSTLLLYGLIFGVFLSMVAYNLIISSFISDQSYRYYILYVSAMAVYQLAYSGVSSILPICFIHHLNHYMLPLALITLITALVFTVSYLNLSCYSRKVHFFISKLFIPVVAVMTVVTFFSTTPFVNYVVHVIAGLALPVIIYAGFISLKRGNLAAKPFLVAWSVLIIGATVFIARSMGVIPHNVFTSNSLMIAAALEALLLSAALAQHIRKMYKEREVLTQRHESLTELSIHDDLTGLFNKRHFEQILSKLLPTVDESTPLSIAVLDVDHFKRYNDTYGHLEGDTVLRVLGELFFDSIEETDIPCRYGGEEFVLIMPETDLEKAKNQAEELRKRVEALQFVTPQGANTQVTASIGVAQYSREEGASQFFIRADEALYKAKEGGRNRVVTAQLP